MARTRLASQVEVESNYNLLNIVIAVAIMMATFFINRYTFVGVTHAVFALVVAGLVMWQLGIRWFWAVVVGVIASAVVLGGVAALDALYPYRRYIAFGVMAYVVPMVVNWTSKSLAPDEN